MDRWQVALPLVAVLAGSCAPDDGAFDEGVAAFDDRASQTARRGRPLLVRSWEATLEQVGSLFGISVATAGDVNADGYDDVIVGALYYDGALVNEGAAAVYLGSSTGLDLGPVWMATSGISESYFGRSAASAGDVDGDGYDDVIIGAYAQNGGRVAVFRGTATGLEDTPAWIAEPAEPFLALYGFSVSSAGDVNGDGYDDVIVGYTNLDPAHVYLGSPAGLEATPSWVAEPDPTGGISVVSAAGDVNGDGYDDVIIGSKYYDNVEFAEGRASVYLGSPAGLEVAASWSAESDQEGAQLGYSVSGAGDVNGDGFDDVVVGVPFWDGGESNEGAVFLYLGTETGLETTAACVGEANLADANLGYSVSAAGDADADGFDDVVAGATGYTNGQSNEGLAVMYFGSATGGSCGGPAWGSEANQKFAGLGTSVSSAGDVDGDGYDDVIAGAPYASDRGDAGAGEGRAVLYSRPP